jgi:hypothetical protein
MREVIVLGVQVYDLPNVTRGPLSGRERQLRSAVQHTIISK